MPKSKTIAVTGMAWITPLGDDLDLVWGRLLAGRTGFEAVPSPGRLRNDLVATVQSVPLELPAEERLAQMASGALSRALHMAGRDASDPDVRLVFGTSLGAFLEESASRQSLDRWANTLACEVGAAAPPVVVSTACSAGADAILIGAELIRAGAARCCVCGGADVMTESKRFAHAALGTMSPTNLRAFDVRHDGTLLGEGAAFVVLEAMTESTTPLAILRGTGSANEAFGMTAADTTGAAARLAIERSLLDAGLEAEQIGLVKAHGSGTPMNDVTERNAFNSVFAGPTRPVVCATKGNFGHSLGATGAIEVVALLCALRSGMAPPIAGLEQPDPEFLLPVPRTEAMPHDARFALGLTLGFGGFDTSLIFEAVP